MTDQDLAIDAPKPAKNGAAKRRGTALSKLMERATSGPSGGGKLRRRRLVFTVAADVCEPGAFDEDFELVLEAPNAEQELAASKKYAAEPGAMIFELIRSCIVSVDGEPVRDSDMSRDAVWEALGFTGRSLIARKFQEINGVSADAAKKADATTRLEVG